MPSTYNLDELAALEAKATKGEWETHNNRDGCYAGTRTLVRSGSREIFGPRQLGYPSVNSKPELEANASLIVAARNHLPAMISDLRAAREMLREREWSEGHESIPYCETCGGLKEYGGHVPTCEFDALIRKLENAG